MAHISLPKPTKKLLPWNKPNKILVSSLFLIVYFKDKLTVWLVSGTRKQKVPPCFNLMVIIMLHGWLPQPAPSAYFGFEFVSNVAIHSFTYKQQQNGTLSFHVHLPTAISSTLANGSLETVHMFHPISYINVSFPINMHLTAHALTPYDKVTPPASPFCHFHLCHLKVLLHSKIDDNTEKGHFNPFSWQWK